MAGGGVVTGGVVGAGVEGVVGAGDPVEDSPVPVVVGSLLGTSGSFDPLAKTCVETQRESNEIKTNFLLNCFILKLLKNAGATFHGQNAGKKLSRKSEESRSQNSKNGLLTRQSDYALTILKYFLDDVQEVRECAWAQTFEGKCRMQTENK